MPPYRHLFSYGSFCHREPIRRAPACKWAIGTRGGWAFVPVGGPEPRLRTPVLFYTAVSGAVEPCYHGRTPALTKESFSVRSMHQRARGSITVQAAIDHPVKRGVGRGPDDRGGQGQEYHRAGLDGERRREHRQLLSLSRSRRPRTVAGRSLRHVRAAGEAVDVYCSSCSWPVLHPGFTADYTQRRGEVPTRRSWTGGWPTPRRIARRGTPPAWRPCAGSAGRLAQRRG
jgi:hypothetical protein